MGCEFPKPIHHLPQDGNQQHRYNLRRFVLASRWIIQAARKKSGKPMAEKLAGELLAAYNNEGDAIKKKQDVHRMAESNRAFAHFSR